MTFSILKLTLRPGVSINLEIN